jgi:hypothetical protein
LCTAAQRVEHASAPESFDDLAGADVGGVRSACIDP